MTTVFLANLTMFFFFFGISPTLTFWLPRFRSGSSRVLISTDLWGRGLDVQQAGSWEWDEVAIVNGAPVFGLENAIFCQFDGNSHRKVVGISELLEVRCNFCWTFFCSCFYLGPRVATSHMSFE